MRLCLFLWNLLSAMFAVSLSNDEDISDEEATSKIPNLSFYKAGTDMMKIPELYLKCKSDCSNGSSNYGGPMFMKEFSLMKPADRNYQPSFKMLDWKSRRKRQQLEKINNLTNVEEPKFRMDFKDVKDKNCQSKLNDQSSKKITKLNSEIKVIPDILDSFKVDVHNENELCSDVNIKSVPKEVSSEDSGRAKRGGNTKVQTNKNFHKNCQSALKDTVALKENESIDGDTIDRDNIISPIKRNQILETELLKIITDCPESHQELRNVSNLRLKRGFGRVWRDTGEVFLDKRVVKNEDEDIQSNGKHSKTHAANSKDVSYLVPSKSPKHSPQAVNIINTVKSKKNDRTDESMMFQSNNSSFNEHGIAGQPKAKIIISSSIISSDPPSESPISQAFCGVNRPAGSRKSTCTTIAFSTTQNRMSKTTMANEPPEEQTECHPQGAGPLNSSPSENDSCGPKSDEEIEDALTGKLADRVIEVIMAKICKTPRMMKELGLYAQGNISYVQSNLIHPEGKEACQEKRTDALKASVLQEIAQAVEKLANTKSTGLCLKPPDDLYDFLSWLLSEDSDMEMPEPVANFIPRREVDYLFRGGFLPSSPENERYIDSKSNWQEWMKYIDDVPMSEPTDGHGDLYENTFFTRRRRGDKIQHRFHHHSRREMRSSAERAHRRQYTPWSLNDYP